MELPTDFPVKFGQLNANLFNYAKGCLIFMINKMEIFES